MTRDSITDDGARDPTGDDHRLTTESEYVGRVRRDAVAGSVWTVAAAVIGAPVSLLANVIVARSLGTAGLGRFGTYSAIFAVAVAVTDLGISNATVQWLASATARGRDGERLDLIRRCSGFHVFLSGPLLAACMFALLVGSNPAQAASAAAAVFVMQVLDTSLIVNTASARNATAARIVLAGNALNQAGLIAIAVATGHAEITFVVDIAFAAVGPLIGVILLPRGERTALFTPLVKRGMPPGFPTYAVSTWVEALVALLVVSQTEVVILRADGYLVAAGVFTIVTTLAGQMTTPIDAVMGPLMPIAAGIYAIDKERAIRIFTRSLKLTSITCTVAVCVLAPIGVVGIRPVYGADYGAAVAPFAALALVSCLQSVLAPLRAFAFASRSAPQMLIINLVCLALDAALALATIPPLGLWGAVLANGAAQLLSLVLMSALVARRLDIPLKEIMSGLALFSAAVAVALPELAACLFLRGALIPLALPAVLIALVSLRLAIFRFSSLRLTDEDVAQLERLGRSHKILLFISALRRVGLAA